MYPNPLALDHRSLPVGLIANGAVYRGLQSRHVAMSAGRSHSVLCDLIIKKVPITEPELHARDHALRGVIDKLPYWFPSQMSVKDKAAVCAAHLAS